MHRPIVLLIVLLFTFSAPAQSEEPIPVLCYHGFVDDLSQAGGKLVDSYDRFEAMLRFLADQQYQSVFPEEVREQKTGGRKRIILTFDDGRKDQMRAAELLSKYGMKGIFFIIPLRLERGSEGSMTHADLKTLVRQGHQIGVHGYAHANMAASQEEVDSALLRSPQVLRNAIGMDIVFPNFAFPFGYYDTATIARVAQQYAYLHTVNPGYWNGSARLLPRMLITNDRSLEFFQSYVEESDVYRPALIPLTSDGAIAKVVEFRAERTVSLDDVEVFAVSADRDGYHYAIHPAGENIRKENNRVSMNLAAHLERYYHESRIVLSYALILLKNGRHHYLSPGVMHWIERP